MYKKIVKSSHSIREMGLKLGLNYDNNGTTWRNLNKFIKDYKIDI